MSKYILINTDVHLDLNEGNYVDPTNDKPLEMFGPISSINVLVGANNSGKSRFLRGLLKTEKHLLIDSEAYYASLRTIKQKIEKLQAEYTDANFIRFEIPKNTNIKEDHLLNDSHRYLIEMIEKSGKVNSTVTLNRDYLRRIGSSLEQMLLGQQEIIAEISKLRQFFHELNVFIALVDEPSYKLNQAVQNRTINGSINKNKVRKIDWDSIKEVVINLKLILGINYHKVVPTKRLYIPILRTSSSLFVKNEEGFERIADNIFRDSIIKNYKLYG